MLATRQGTVCKRGYIAASENRPTCQWVYKTQRRSKAVRRELRFVREEETCKGAPRRDETEICRRSDSHAALRVHVRQERRRGLRWAHRVWRESVLRVLVVLWYRCRQRVRLCPLARALTGRPLLLGAELEHLGVSGQASRGCAMWSYLLGDDVELVLRPVLMRHAQSPDIRLAPNAHSRS